MSEKILEGVTYRYRFVTDKRNAHKRAYPVRAQVKRYPGMEAWRFAFIPVKTSSLIKKAFGHTARGWGSLRVKVTLGDTVWQTSIFPDKKAGAYVLPLKAAVRKAEGVRDGATIILTLEIL